MIIDGHAHIFTPRIIANVSAKRELAELLHLDLAGAPGRTAPAVLVSDAASAHVAACLILPTAAAGKVSEVNRQFRKTAEEFSFISTAGTLHPRCRTNVEELELMRAAGVRAIKLCSFSQGFSLLAPETQDLFKLVEEANKLPGGGFFVILDTLYPAHTYFGTPAAHTTTPALLGEVVRAYGGINFVAAHMGGQAAPPQEIFAHLKPAENLYLDTSASHTLVEGDFVRLLKEHGPERIIFGTDWPWFGYRAEIDLIGQRLARAGFGPEDKERVFSGNIAGLLGVSQIPS